MSRETDVSNIRSIGVTSAQSGSVRGGRVYKFQPQKLQVTLNQHILLIVGMSVGAPPTVLTHTEYPAYAVNVAVSGNIAYVAQGDGLRILDISNPSAPLVIGTFDGTSP